jgi:two-component system OmpR family response regulator
MRVLVVEDEIKLAALLRRGLLEEGHAADVAASGEDALWMAQATPYDAIVLDLMLPGIDGLEVCRRLRGDGVWSPVLMLTARDGVGDRVGGLDAGADDYLTKPFAFAELLARVQALVRRATHTAEPSRLSVGDLTMDLLTRRVERAGQRLDLRPREFALLEYLMRNAGKVLSKTMILSHVWGYSFDPNTNIVDVLVSRLRDKIDRPFDGKLLHTVRGVGYVLKPADAAAP